MPLLGSAACLLLVLLLCLPIGTLDCAALVPECPAGPACEWEGGLRGACEIPLCLAAAAAACM